MRSERLRSRRLIVGPSTVCVFVRSGSPERAAVAIRNDPESTLILGFSPGTNAENAVVVRSRLLLPALVAVLAGPPAAFASVTVTTNAQRPALRVDARGYA